MMHTVFIQSSDILCSLGDKHQSTISIKKGLPNISQKEIVNEGDIVKYPYYTLPKEPINRDINKLKELLFNVVNNTIADAGLSPKEIENTAIYIGSSGLDLSVEVPVHFSMNESYINEIPYQRVGNGYYADLLQNKFGLKSVAFTYNTACTSSANALLDASEMIKSGQIEHALVVGLEFFEEVVFTGFFSMQLLSPTRLAPFDSERDGIVLGEAISAVILGKDKSDWELIGGVSNCETYSVTGAHPDGVSIAALMKKVLKLCNIDLKEITAIKAHGTASALNDLAEINAMKLVFGNDIPDFYSLKPYIGHTLGGCGTAELVLQMLSVDSGCIPKSLHFESIDRQLNLKPLVEHKLLISGTFLMNHFGFGGNNTSYIIRKLP